MIFILLGKIASRNKEKIGLGQSDACALYSVFKSPSPGNLVATPLHCPRRLHSTKNKAATLRAS